jgi:hypothetical protein
MRARHHAVVRERRVVEEDGLSGDVPQQDARGDDDEIGFAERQQSLVVQQAQGQAGRGLGHGHDGPHATVDGERRGAVLLHQVLEGAVEHKRVHHELPVRLERGARKRQVLGGPALGAGDAVPVLEQAADAFLEVVVAGLDNFELEPLPRHLDRVPRVLALRAAQRHDPGSGEVLRRVEPVQPPQQLAAVVHHHVVDREAGSLGRIPGKRLEAVRPEVADAQRFIPVIDRAGAVPHENDGVAFFRNAGPQEVAGTRRGVNDVHVGAGLARARGRFDAGRRGHRKRFQREVRLGCDGLQLF